MLLATSTVGGIILAIAGLVLVGSWQNLFRFVRVGPRKPPVQVLLYDFHFVRTIVSFLLAVTVDPLPALYALLGGITNCLGFLLVLQGEALIGMALAFPISTSLQLGLGISATYLIEREGNPYFLFSGVAVILVGTGLSALTSHEKNRSRKAVSPNTVEMATPSADRAALSTEEARTFHSQGGKSEESTSTKETTRGVILSALSGVILSAWNPLGTLALQGKHPNTNAFTGLSVYSMLFYFMTASMATNLLVGTLVLYRPIVKRQPRSSLTAYWRLLSLSDHLLLVGSGLVSVAAFACNFLAGRAAGFAIAFALFSTSPVVQVAWGILLWKEFHGTSTLAKLLVGGMTATYLIAIGLITASKLV